ncbi:MAG: hypothetical protein AB7F35_00530 [Acetobacteraceae bacterium]
MTIIPQNVNLVIYQGADFSETFFWQTQADDGTLTTVNLTGYSARLQARATVEAATMLLNLDTATRGGISIDPLNGAITVSLTASRTAALSFGESGTAAYDLEVESADGHVIRLVQGTLRLSLEVTRA